ncbi:MAG: hypothetical protein AUG51_20935 [Acidobacteria bacterium 13_1_20CM_3_53_8]|nr:MAG: hypothetical protein AUG51_20935 [Acidobacteria bacterium 13_1_20CM_3_53_8]
MPDDKFATVLNAARNILDTYGHAAPDTSRVVYTDGDLNIAEEDSITEIIYRGTLVFRHAPESNSEENFINDDGEWDEMVERISGDIQTPPVV